MLNIYHNAIRDHVDLLYRRGRADRLIVWQVNKDEVYDPTLISLRAYRSRDYSDVVKVCAGVNTTGDPIKRSIIYMPQAADLMLIRRKYLSEGK